MSKSYRLASLSLAIVFAFSWNFGASASAGDPLPSWNDVESKQAIISFVEKVTKPGPNYVPPAERIATFDNDGTILSESPSYVQLAFVIKRVKELAPQHPQWKDKQPFKGVLEGDMKAVADSGEHGVVELVMATHSGMTADEFTSLVENWLANAKHPKTGRPYTEMVYQPMLELLAYLRANDFRTYIVSAGGLEFMRPWTEKIYGIPPEQVIGSSIKTIYEIRDGRPVLVRLSEINFLNDKAGKPVAINQYIGKRPIFAAGNSDGDREMLEWTTAGEGPRFGLIVHHTDAQREAAYDRESSIGRLDKALDQAETSGWTVVDMKNDWKVIYPKREKASR
ncbi:MAG: haloacid dehalogenase-like hydrolase [Planctomycetaceae bacterium]|nr:haloacid dehalogenase-like hydrolase [Planctomycetaceae bacterium]